MKIILVALTICLIIDNIKKPPEGIKPVLKYINFKKKFFSRKQNSSAPTFGTFIFVYMVVDGEVDFNFKIS